MEPQNHPDLLTLGDESRHQDDEAKTSEKTPAPKFAPDPFQSFGTYVQYPPQYQMAFGYSPMFAPPPTTHIYQHQTLQCKTFVQNQ